MLCNHPESLLDDDYQLEKGHQKQPSLPAASDSGTVFNLLGILIVNDSKFSIPVCIDLLPTLSKFMDSANRLTAERYTCTMQILLVINLNGFSMLCSHLLEVISVVSVITTKFGRSVMTSTPGITKDTVVFFRNFRSLLKCHAQVLLLNQSRPTRKTCSVRHC